MIKRNLGVFFLSVAFFAASHAGEFSNTTVSPSLTWKPIVCQKPAKLFFHIHDVDSYVAAVEEYNLQLLKVRTYRTCISDEAQKDAEAVTNAVSGGLDQANEKVRLEMDAARSELNSAKRSLQ